MIALDCINHMSIAVNDIERSKKFYTEMLGMKEIVDIRSANIPRDFKPPADPLFVNYGSKTTKRPCRLECGGVEVTLFERPEAVDPEAVARGRGIFHYSYRLDYPSVKALCDDTDGLRAKGYDVPFEPKPLVLPDGTTYLRLYLRDPDGNLMEIVGWPPQNTKSAPGQTGHPEAWPS